MSPRKKTVKERYKIWDWKIHREHGDWHSLNGTTDQYEGGRHIRSSRIVKIDFEKGIAETVNSIYELQSEDCPYAGY